MTRQRRRRRQRIQDIHQKDQKYVIARVWNPKTHRSSLKVVTKEEKKYGSL